MLPIIVLGPTGVGKSLFSIKLAKELKGEIINADSMQIYEGLDIGTAKLKEEEWEGIPHHLFSFISPEKPFSAGKYREKAIQIIENLRKNNKRPIIVGGTGFYIRTLLKGLDPIPEIPLGFRKKLKKLIERGNLSYFYKILFSLDKNFAQKISNNDVQRIERAIEVIFYTGKPLSFFLKGKDKKADDFPTIKIGLFLPKKDLKNKIILRVKEMLKEGWVEEVKELLKKGISTDSQAFKSIGYREIKELLEGKINLEEAKEKIIKNTISYAKRQMTWFKREEGVFWVFAKNLELAIFIALRYIKRKDKGVIYG